MCFRVPDLPQGGQKQPHSSDLKMKEKKKIPKTLSNVLWRERNLPMRSTDKYFCGEYTNSCLEVGERRTRITKAAKTSTGYNCIIFIQWWYQRTLPTCTALVVPIIHFSKFLLLSQIPNLLQHNLTCNSYIKLTNLQSFKDTEAT